MLCGCLDFTSPYGYDERSNKNRNKNEVPIVTAYPGRRGGNNVMYPNSPMNGNSPSGQLYAPVQATAGNALKHYEPPQNYVTNDTRNKMNTMTVIVPQGVSPGQTINVATPDGQLVSSVVPAGMGTGSSFTMQYPSSVTVVPNSTTQISPVPPPVTSVPVDPITQKPIRAFPVNEKKQSNEEELQEPITATLVEEDDEQNSKDKTSSPPPTAPTVYPTNPTVAHNAVNNQKLLHVQVPAGTPAGSTIHVQIPGENGRMVAAVVPPGVSQFQVAYEPQIQQTPVVVSSSSIGPPQATRVFPSNSMPQTTYPSNYPNSNPVSYPPQGNNQRLLLVKVPPGTPPGVPLRVQIPGENRMVEAIVPPGVSEFHVAYTPMQKNQYYNQNGQAMNRNPNPRNQYNHQNRNNQNVNGQNNQYPYNNNNNKQNGGGLGSMAAPFVVGALAGAAVGSMMNHHTHHNDYDQNYHGSNEYFQNDSNNVDNEENYVEENNNDYAPYDVDNNNDVEDDYGGGDDYGGNDDYGDDGGGGFFDFGGGDGGGDFGGGDDF